MKRNPLRPAAYHEAGHAIACMECGLAFGAIKLFADPEPAQRGDGSTDPFLERVGTMLQPPSMTRIGPHILPVLDREARKLPADQAAAMKKRAIEAARNGLVCLVAGAVAEARYSRRSFIETVRRGGQRDRQHAASLARSLADYLEDVSAAELLTKAISVARALVRRPVVWAAHERVAEALLEQGHLDFDEVERVARCRSRYDRAADWPAEMAGG